MRRSKRQREAQSCGHIRHRLPTCGAVMGRPQGPAEESSWGLDPREERARPGHTAHLEHLS